MTGLGFVQKQVPDRRRNTNKTTLTLTLSRPTGEGTARPVFRSFQSGWIRRPTEDDSPSPIRWERAGVRVILLQNPKLFLREPLAIGSPPLLNTPEVQSKRCDTGKAEVTTSVPSSAGRLPRRWRGC